MAGCYDGYVGSIHNGCRGFIACAMLACNSGHITSIANSCSNGDRSCYAVARYHGYINSMVNSCNDAFDVCYGAASGKYIRGESISGYYIGSTYIKGNITSLIYSCSGVDNACRLAGSSGGTIHLITNSCLFGEGACMGIAKSGGTINVIYTTVVMLPVGAFMQQLVNFFGMALVQVQVDLSVPS